MVPLRACVGPCGRCAVIAVAPLKLQPQPTLRCQEARHRWENNRVSEAGFKMPRFRLLSFSGVPWDSWVPFWNHHSPTTGSVALRRPWRGSSAASHHEVPIIPQGVMFWSPLISRDWSNKNGWYKALKMANASKIFHGMKHCFVPDPCVVPWLRCDFLLQIRNFACEIPIYHSKF